MNRNFYTLHSNVQDPFIKLYSYVWEARHHRSRTTAADFIIGDDQIGIETGYFKKKKKRTFEIMS